jgi:peptide chain release factor 1
MVQIVTLTSTLSDTSEDGITTVGLGDVVDELLNEDSLADTSTSEQTNFSSTSVWGEEIDDLDTGHENLSSGRLLSEWWSIGVDGSTTISLDWATLINWVTSDVHDATKSLWADWDGDWTTSIVDAVATDETLSTIHSNATDDVLSQMLSNLKDELLAAIECLQGVENGRKLLGIELHIDDGSDDLMDLAMDGLGAGEAQASLESWTESSASCCCHRWADSLE